jgi:hypothetical protein
MNSSGDRRPKIGTRPRLEGSAHLGPKSRFTLQHFLSIARDQLGMIPSPGQGHVSIMQMGEHT